MIERQNNRLAWLFCVALLATSSCAQAQDWHYSAELYGLASDVSASTAFGRDVGADFDDILDNLEFGVFGSLAASRGKLSLYGNLAYVDLEADKTRSAGPATARLNAGLENVVATLGAGWALHDGDNARLNLVAGARYLSLDADFRLQLELTAQRRSDRSESVWDGVVGVQGRVDVAERWYLNYYADVGAGESDLTWQAAASINYRFRAVDLSLGYQYLKWELDKPLLEELEIAGPGLGLRFHW